MKTQALLAAIAGVIACVKVVGKSAERPPEKPPTVQPSRSPYPFSVAATGIIEADDVTLVVTERTMEPLDAGVFTSAGVDPARHDYLILKSRMYCRPVFVPLAHAVIECDSRGVTSATRFPDHVSADAG